MCLVLKVEIDFLSWGGRGVYLCRKKSRGVVGSVNVFGEVEVFIVFRVGVIEEID